MEDGQQSIDAQRYAAFISYSHSDQETARWLQQRIENYRVPTALVGQTGRFGPIGKRVGKLYRDRYDAPAGGTLREEIDAALTQSDALIVVCSPRAAASKHVNEEIAHFRGLGRGARIVPVIIEGDPETSFPPALMQNGEPLGADLRAGKDERAGGVLKVIAGLLGVGLDELQRRERRAQLRRMQALTFALVLVSTLAVAAVWQTFEAFQGRSAARLAQAGESSQRDRAELALARIFIERAHGAYAVGQTRQALRYALAGRQLRPSMAEEVRDVLGEILQAPTSYSSTLAFNYGETADAYVDGDSFIAYAANRQVSRLTRVRLSDLRTETRDTPEHWAANPMGDAPLSPKRYWFSGDGRCATATTYSGDTQGVEVVPLNGDTRLTLGISPARDIAISADCSRAAVLRLNHTIEIMSVGNAVTVATIPVAQDLASFRLSPNGRTLVLATRRSGVENRCDVQIWNGGALDDAGVVDCTSDGGAEITFGRDGRSVILVSGDYVGLPGLSDEDVEDTLGDFHDLSRDRSALLSCDRNGILRVLHVSTRTVLYAGRIVTPAIVACAFRGEGVHEVAAMSSDGRVHVVDLSPRRLTDLLNPWLPTDATLPIRPLRASDRWVYGETDSEARYWRRGDTVRSRRSTGSRDITNRAVGPEWRARATHAQWSIGAPGPVISFFARDREDGAFPPAFMIMRSDMSAVADLAGFSNWAIAAHTSPSGNLIAIVTSEGSAGVWDARSGAVLYRLERIGGAENVSVGFISEEELILADTDGRLRRLRWRSNTEVSASTSLGFRITGMDIHPAREEVVVAGAGGEIVRVSIADYAVRARTRNQEAAVGTVNYSPDGTRIATIEGDAAIIRGRQSLAVLAHFEGRYSAIFSEDGNSMIAGGVDVASVYDISMLAADAGSIASTACRFLDAGERRFTVEEIASDPLIRDVWLEAGIGGGDVCAGY